MKAFSLLAATLIGSATAFCPNSCSGHGECGESDKCVCYPKFTGSDCSKRECTYGLSWVAGTDAELEQASVPNYMHHDTKGYHNKETTGEVQGFHAYTECSGKGLCDSVVGQCKCFPGYTGSGCRRSACPNDCSGHGRCVLDADLYQTSKTSYQPTETYYGRDQQLNYQKQYWNNRKTTQCICDAGFTGADCSTRMCPKGDDPSTSCTTELDYSDVQLVGIRYSNAIDATKPEKLEQYFTLKFTDMFNNEYETKPLSYFDSATTVQGALRNLPNYAVPDVEVFKMFPEDMEDDTPIAYTGGENGADPIVDGANPADFCSTFYHTAMQDVSCETNDDCVGKFGLTSYGLANNNADSDPADSNPAGGSRVFCDLSASKDAHVARGTGGRGICVETMNTCGYLDGKTEFEAGCGDHFEPDGIYDASTHALVKEWDADSNPLPIGCFAKNLVKKDNILAEAGTQCGDQSSKEDCESNAAGCFWQPAAGNLPTEASPNDHTAGGLVWGRRLTSFERSCHVGKFDENKVAFHVACTTDSDCTRCGGWTQVTAGVCDSGKCMSVGDATVNIANGRVGGRDGNPLSNGFPDIKGGNPSAAVTTFNTNCRTALFAIKFSAEGNPGKQNLLEVTTGDMDTLEAGAAPMYRSDGLSSMGVVHAGIPDFVQGDENKAGADYEVGSKQPKQFGVKMIAQDGSSSIASVDKDLCTEAGITTQCLDHHKLNLLAAAQTFNVQSYEGDQEDVPKLVVSTKKIYTNEEINTRFSANYDEVLQCSNQGACGYTTGLCTCASGFSGDSCSTQVSFV